VISNRHSIDFQPQGKMNTSQMLRTTNGLELKVPPVAQGAIMAALMWSALLMLLGWAAFLSNILALVVLPAFVLCMNRFQIIAEERVLASLFANDYAEYCARVRRWL
jgi:hypothetical protein